MRIEREQAAVLVVDYQEKLVPVMYEKELLIRNSQLLLEGIKVLDIPMYITQQYTKGLGMTVEEITSVIGNDAYVDKIAFSAFDAVKNQIWDKKFIIICGIETHICVLQTIIDLKEAGFVPVLVADCVTSRKESDKVYAIERARQEGAIITTYESLLFELLKEAGTETSKKIQKIIK